MLLVPEKSDSSIAGTSGWWGPAVEYMIDAGQRSVLYWDTMRQRGNSFREKAKTVTHVPEFASELVFNGGSLTGRSITVWCASSPKNRRHRSESSSVRRAATTLAERGGRLPRLTVPP